MYAKKHRIVLTFPYKDIANIKQMFPGNESTSWVYLGRDFLKKRRTEKDLGNCFRHVNIAKLHDQVSADLRGEYARWMDDLNKRYGNDLEWWFGSISSRNPYNSNIFQFCCYLEILERLWKDGDKRPGLIVIESIGLAQAIQKWASKKNIVVEIIHNRQARLRSSIYHLRFFFGWGKFFVTLMFRWIAAYVTRVKFTSKKHGVNPSVIIDTFLHDYCISDDGTFKDRYFPYLHEYLSEKGMIVLVHPVLFGFHYNYFPIYRKMRVSKTHFILREDFLHFADYLCALVYPLKVLREEIKAAPLRGFDLHDILKEEKKQQPIISSMESVLIYHLFLRLGEYGLRPRQIIDWYENQVIDKALIAGARKAFPRARIIGAQIFIHNPNFISLFPSQSEADAQIVPHLLLETSQHQCQVAQAYTKTIPCKSAAALRYSHIFNDENVSNRCLENSQKILVLLPFSIGESVELLETLKEIMEQITDDTQILIKGHPDYAPEELLHVFGEHNWPQRFKIFQGSLPDALILASVVISSNSSSMVEAASKGIPVIFLGRQTALNQNILSNLNMDIMTECFSTSELTAAIEKYLNLSHSEKIRYKEMGQKVRDLFFEPVNERTLSSFLDIEE